MSEQPDDLFNVPAVNEQLAVAAEELANIERQQQRLADVERQQVGRRTIYFDIETLPNFDAERMRALIAPSVKPPGNMSKAETIRDWETFKRPAIIEEKYRATGLKGSTGHICVIGWAIDEEPPQSLHLSSLDADAEALMLATFFARMRQAARTYRTLLVGHNHIGFDIPFVYQRAVILGVPPPAWWPGADIPPYNNDRVYDTMKGFAGTKTYIKMDALCGALGLDGKGSEFIGTDDEDEEVDGSKVYDLVRAGKIQTVAKYCRGDVSRTRAMHYRLRFLRPLDIDMAQPDPEVPQAQTPHPGQE